MGRKRRKSSDEVTVEISGSDPSSKRYWNLRESEEASQNQSERPIDGINVEFNLSENRALTEEQKQTILNTLIENPKDIIEEEGSEDENRFNKWTILLFLVALSGPAVAFLMINNVC